MSFGEGVIAALTGGGASLARMEAAQLLRLAQQRLSRRGRAAAELGRMATAFTEGIDEELAEELQKLSDEDKTAAAEQMDDALTDQPDDPPRTAEIHRLAQVVTRNLRALGMDERAQDGFLYKPDIVINEHTGSIRGPVLVGTIPRLADEYQPRSSVATELDQVFRPGATVVFTGTAGNGKTQIAADTARMIRDTRSANLVMWAQSTSRGSIQSSYAKAARSLGIVAADARADDASEAMVNWFETTERTWLVVLDDLADPADLRGLWPAGPRGRTLITTQRRDPVLRHQHRYLVEVDQFSPDEALNYLIAKLSAEQLVEAAELAADLYYLPLALAQACAVIVDEDTHCAAYRKRFIDRRQPLAELMPEDASADEYASAENGDHRATLATTWRLAIERANALRPVGVAKPLLELASYLDPNGMPAAVFDTDAVLGYVRGEAPGTDAAAVRLASRNLQRLSLLTFSDDKAAIRVHGLVQRAVRDTLQSDTSQPARRAACAALLQIWPETDYQPQYALLASSLRANAEALANSAEPNLWLLGVTDVIFRTGYSLREGGLRSASITYWTAQVEEVSRPDAFSSEYSNVLASRNHLTTAYLDAGRLSEALALAEATLFDSDRVFGSDAPITLACRNNLALVYRAAGRLADAFPLLRTTLETSEQVLGGDHLNTLSSRNNLALTYRAAGRLDDALNLFATTLADRERLLGLDHPDTLTSRNNLATAYHDTGRLDDALRLYESTLANRERILGRSHPATLASRNNLAEAYRTAGRLDDALPLLEATLVDNERSLGINHPDTLTSRNNLATAYHDIGRYSEALRLLENTLTERERILGPDHPDTALSRINLDSHWRVVNGSSPDS